MAYTRVWDETTPSGASFAADLDVDIQQFKTDIRERFASVFGLDFAEFSADPIAPKTLSLATGLVLGTTPALTGLVRAPNNQSIVVARNAADSADIVLTKLNASDLAEFAAGKLTINPSTGVSAIAGTLTVGTGTAAGSAQPLEVTNDAAGGCGIAMSTGSTGLATAVECYLTAFMPASNGIQYKMGALAWQYAVKTYAGDAAYMSVNLHASYFVGGAQVDDIFFTGYGNNGAAFFSGSTAAADAPGNKILRVNGALQVTTTSLHTGVATFTAAPIFSSGTASQTMELTAGKALTTVAITGTGNYVKSVSPTFTGTITAAILTASGVITALSGIVMPNNTYVSGTTTGAATVNLIGLNASDQLELNANSQRLRFVGLLTQTTVGAAGGASALPATPLGYAQGSISGVGSVLFPYYISV